MNKLMMDILQEIAKGKQCFRSDNSSPSNLSVDDARNHFQLVGQALAHADELGFLNSLDLRSESQTGRHDYAIAFIPLGLSLAGYQFLREKASAH